MSKQADLELVAAQLRINTTVTLGSWAREAGRRRGRAGGWYKGQVPCGLGLCSLARG